MNLETLLTNFGKVLIYENICEKRMKIIYGKILFAKKLTVGYCERIKRRVAVFWGGVGVVVTFLRLWNSKGGNTLHMLMHSMRIINVQANPE